MMDQIKTSIILPLRDEGRVFGVLDLESTSFLEITELAKPKLFLASSSKADQEANAVLRSVLDTYSNRLEVVTWYEISKSGNINQHIIREILSSSYGVCYFSEAVDGPPATRYQDNPNVLFEAGMLHVLSYADQSSSEGSLPIRESKSPKLPFDFAAERILTVPRLQNGSLNVPAFENELRNRLNNLLT